MNRNITIIIDDKFEFWANIISLVTILFFVVGSVMGG